MHKHKLCERREIIKMTIRAGEFVQGSCSVLTRFPEGFQVGGEDADCGVRS